jgi:hypothetical protein
MILLEILPALIGIIGGTWLFIEISRDIRQHENAKRNYDDRSAKYQKDGHE